MEPKTKTEKLDNLLNDFQDIAFIEIVMVILGAWLTILLVRKLFPALAERAPSKLRLYFLAAVPIIRLLVLAGAVLWIIPIIFNVTFQNFVVIAGAASVALGFAFKDYVSSLIAGIVAIFERPYRPGDWVKIGDHYGEVQSVGMRSIRMLTPSDDIITVPHNRLWDENLANSNDGTHTLMCIAHFYLEPEHDVDTIRAALRDVALTSPYLKYDKPVLAMVAETPFATQYQLKAYPFDMRDQFAFISDLTARGKIAITRAGGVQVAMGLVGGADHAQRAQKDLLQSVPI